MLKLFALVLVLLSSASQAAVYIFSPDGTTRVITRTATGYTVTSTAAGGSPVQVIDMGTNTAITGDKGTSWLMDSNRRGIGDMPVQPTLNLDDEEVYPGETLDVEDPWQ